MSTQKIATDMGVFTFEGELLLEVASSADNTSDNYSGCTGRWQEVQLWRTRGRKYVIAIKNETLWQGERPRTIVSVADRLSDLYSTVRNEIFTPWLRECLFDYFSNIDPDSCFKIP